MTTLRLLGRTPPDPRAGALLPALFWAGQAGSFAFPGAAGIRSEFPDPLRGPWAARLDERLSSVLLLGLIGLGYALARRPPHGRRARLTAAGRRPGPHS